MLREHDLCYALTRERYPCFVMECGGKPCASDRVVLGWQPIPNVALFDAVRGQTGHLVRDAVSPHAVSCYLICLLWSRYRTSWGLETWVQPRRQSHVVQNLVCTPW